MQPKKLMMQLKTQLNNTVKEDFFSLPFFTSKENVMIYKTKYNPELTAIFKEEIIAAEIEFEL